MAALSGRTTPQAGRRESLAGPITLNGASVVNPTKVKVVVRIRPVSAADAGRAGRFKSVVVHSVGHTTLQIEGAPSPAGPSTASALAKAGTVAPKQTFTFDRVIGPEEGQPDVYDEAGPLVDSFLAGMNVTILAYGQTSSGKSYTMGTDRTSPDDDVLGPERLGITPRAVADIFDRIATITKQSNGATTFQAKLSYVELHNEDLIDLLAGDADVRPTVQIREDKSGTIIWSGLREVKVNSAIEVMNLLTAGSALRQTNSTDMNAQSSRSHAIFSLTLTQRKYTGTGTPPSPPQSRLAGHRLSGLPLPRVTSPTPGARAGTPDRPASRISGLRPPSALGSHRPQSPSVVAGDENGVDSWSTITSKFHFVDLAGSERLKRTAAQGERVKEGISINSGLHALGNVISALGDPAKARQTTHIPYRDSKLTRLLQDSLGGNAHTMMIACVSPTELNVSETVSTVKYANRARNIKNTATINEVEVGWDDLDYLQKTILKLRADLAGLRSGEASAGMGSIREEGGASTRALQDEVLALRERCARLVADLQLAKQQGSSSVGVRVDFAAAIETVAEEYEKSLSALESQLSLTKAALGHSEEEMQELEARIEDEVRANEQSSKTIEDLKLRVARLSEREATTEAYVRDLECKLGEQDQLDRDHGSAVSDLRKEISKHREQAETTEAYIKELETRLGEADNGNSALKRQIDVLERDIDRREESYRELEGRLTLLDTSGDHKQLLAEIDDKDRRVNELERTLDELKAKHAAVEKEASTLTDAANAAREAKAELQSRVRTLERQTVLSHKSSSSHLEDGSVRADAITTLEAQLSELQAKQDETVAQLEEVQLKYRDSLREIDDLNSQVQENKLLNGGRTPSESRSVPGSPSGDKTAFPNGSGDGDDDEVERLSPSAVDGTAPNGRSHSPASSISALSNGSTARTPRSRRSMPLAPGHRLSFLGRGQGATAGLAVGSSASLSRSASLSQELSSAQQSQPTSSSPTSHTHSLSLSSPSLNRQSFYGPSSLDHSPTAGERSYEQMKGEVMKLQQALNEREQEITQLESTLRTAQNSPVIRSTVTLPDAPDSPSPMKRSSLGADLVNGTSAESPLSPSLDEEALAPMDDLMRAMAKKESSHREKLEQLEDDHATLKRQHDELTVLSRDQVVNMSSDIERLRAQLEARPEASHYESRLQAMEADLAAKAAQVDQTRQQAEAELAAVKANLAEELQRVTSSLKAEHESVLTKVHADHAEALKKAFEDRDETLRQKDLEQAAALKSLATEHDEALRLRTVDHEGVLQMKQAEHDSALKRVLDEKDELLKQHELEKAALVESGQEGVTNSLEQLKQEHATALQKREADYQAHIDKVAADHKDALASRDVSHASTLAELRSTHDGAVNELIAAHSTSITTLRAEHDSHIATVTAEGTAALAALGATHLATSTATQTEHEAKVREMTETHSSALDELRKQHQGNLEAQASSLITEHGAKTAALTEEHKKAIEVANTSHEVTLAALAEKHKLELEKAGAAHQDALAKQAEEHAAANEATTEAHRDAVALLVTEHESSTETLRAATDKAQAELEASIAAIKEQHASLAESVAAEHAAALEKQAKEHASLIDEYTGAHAEQLQVVEAQRDEAHSARQALEGQLAQSPQLNGSGSPRFVNGDAGADGGDLHARLKALIASEAENKSKLEGLTREFDLHRIELARTKQERDSLAGQVARFSVNSSRPGFQETNDSPFRVGPGTPDRSPMVDVHGSPASRHDRFGSILGSPTLSGKPPPPTPPPSMPPPPLPTGTPTRSVHRSSSQSSMGTVNTANGSSLRMSTDLTSPGTSIRSSTGTVTSDPNLVARFAEQEAALAKVTKSLAHCEGDLQATIELVNTLESALNDSERNLRKARTQMNDLARERDSFQGINNDLRSRVQEAEQESETLRQSVVDLETEKQRSRREEDMTKARFEQQMAEVDRRKSKFVCF